MSKNLYVCLPAQVFRVATWVGQGESWRVRAVSAPQAITSVVRTSLPCYALLPAAQGRGQLNRT